MSTATLDTGGGSQLLDVEGMTCQGCAGHVQRTLSSHPGVVNATVNLALARARIETDAGFRGLEELEAAVGAIGYQIHPRQLASRAATPADLANRDVRLQGRRAAFAGAFSAPVFVLGMLGLGGEAGRLVQWLLATPVVFIFGLQFHRVALERARVWTANMDTLVSLGTLSAYGYSIWALATGHAVFFETAAVIVSFILLGRYLEARARGRACESISMLMELGPAHVSVVRDGEETRVGVADLLPGDLFVVRPGERVATDGVVEEGSSSFDESMLTGESLPVDHGPGDGVVGGAVNRQGRVLVRATRVGEETRLAQIIQVVEEAQAGRAPVQRLVDRISAVFVPVVLSVAAITLVGGVLAGLTAELALQNAVAVLVIACPCALGLATPTAILVGTGRGAELGVLFKGGETFERARSIDTVVFDKTGTLTRGEMELTDVLSDSAGAELLARAASVESASEHPIARAVVDGARQRGGSLNPVVDFESFVGLGVSGRVEGVEVAVGGLALMQQRGVAISSRWRDAQTDLERKGRTTFLVAWAGEVQGVIGVADAPRATAAEVVRELRSEGIEVAMVTGDNEGTARAVADQLGIERVIAGALPEAKAREIRRLRESGRVVAFVGDGINDAPALIEADLGIAMGGGTDIAKESGDVVLLSGDPKQLPLALRIGRRGFRTIAQNLAWALVYNSAAIPIAAFGLLNPMVAAAAMAASSVSVVANSLRLRRIQPG